MIDEKWFKLRQRKVGVTADDIAKRMGRSRSAVSHIYMGRQPMSLEWAKAFSDVLQVPLDEVLEHAGVTDQKTSRQLEPGFSESDASAWTPAGGDGRSNEAVAAALGMRPGVDVWTMRGRSMTQMGILPGDFLLIDTHAAERVKAGDVVVAQVYDNVRGRAITLIRRLEPPVLVAASSDPADERVHVVDGVNVVVRGKVVATWRQL